MEEADLLSDRCFVLSEGQIVASGSSLDIKSREGLGTLVLERDISKWQIFI